MRLFTETKIKNLTELIQTKDWFNGIAVIGELEIIIYSKGEIPEEDMLLIPCSIDEMPIIFRFLGEVGNLYFGEINTNNTSNENFHRRLADQPFRWFDIEWDDVVTDK